MTLLRADIKSYMILSHICPMCRVYNTSAIGKGLGPLAPSQMAIRKQFIQHTIRDYQGDLLHVTVLKANP